MAYEKVFYCCGVHIHYCWSFQNPWKEWNQFDSHLKQILIHCSNLEAKNESEPELWICSQHVNISPAFTFASNVDFWLRHIAFSCIQMRHQVTCEAHVEDTAEFKKVNQNPLLTKFHVRVVVSWMRVFHAGTNYSAVMWACTFMSCL